MMHFYFYFPISCLLGPHPMQDIVASTFVYSLFLPQPVLFYLCIDSVWGVVLSKPFLCSSLYIPLASLLLLLCVFVPSLYCAYLSVSHISHHGFHHEKHHDHISHNTHTRYKRVYTHSHQNSPNHESSRVELSQGSHPFSYRIQWPYNVRSVAVHGLNAADTCMCPMSNSNPMMLNNVP